MAEVLYVTQKQNEYIHKDEFSEKNSGEIMTVQNDAYTIRELLAKFTTGVFKPEMFMRSGEYIDNEFDIEVPEFIDVTDIEEYQRNVNAKLEALKKTPQTVKSSPVEPEKDGEGTKPDEKGEAGES